MNEKRASLGVIGAGMMGAGMAHRLLQHGYDLHVVAHRNRAPIDELVAAGAHEQSNAPDIARACSIIVLCLPNADIVTDIMEAIAPVLGDDGLVVDTTTSLPATSRRWAETLRTTGRWFVDAPVTGAPEDAAAGRLKSLVGADAAAFELARPILACTSDDIVRFGGPGAGHAAKLINNSMTQALSALTIEAMRRCDRIGIDRELMFRIMSNNAARSGIFMRIMPSVLAGNYDGLKFALGNAAKDVRYVAEMCRDIGEDSPMVRGLQAFYARELENWPRDTFVSRLLGPPIDKETATGP